MDNSMNDGYRDDIDEGEYSNLPARVNDGDNGYYGVADPLENIGRSRNDVVLGWEQEEPLLIHTDLKTCQQCGSKLRNVTEADCKSKKCDTCGWSVQKNGFPALVKMEHEYPNDFSKSGESAPGYTSQKEWLDRLANDGTRELPDSSVRISGGKHSNRLDHSGLSRDGIVEHLDGQRRGLGIYSIGVIIAIAVLAYRLMTLGAQMNPLQIIFEVCAAIYFSWVYIVVVAIMMAMQPQEKR